jgi:transcription initiation factor TFIIB
VRQHVPEILVVENFFLHRNILCDQLSFPKTISDIPKQLYKHVDEEKLPRSKPVNAVIAASIFIAYISSGPCAPVRFAKFRTLQTYGRTCLYNATRPEQALNLTPGSSAARADAKSGTRPEDIPMRFCNRLDLPPHVQAICTDIAVAPREHGIAGGHSPSWIVGGAIYFACLLLGVPKFIKEIAAQGVSEDYQTIVSVILHRPTKASQG